MSKIANSVDSALNALAARVLKGTPMKIGKYTVKSKTYSDADGVHLSFGIYKRGVLEYSQLDFAEVLSYLDILLGKGKIIKKWKKKS